MKSLLHRWFVQYNPLYLLSAALVLRGVNLIAHGTLGHGRFFGALAGPAIAEVYAWALVAAAALLVRLGLRRPAVMLALIAVVYQGDLTLHTETCAWIGALGWLAAGVWLASFVLKLRALAWAMRLRLSASARVVPVLGAAGLVLVPRLIAHASAREATAVVAAWLFAVFGAGVWTRRRVESIAGLDEWGRTVLRRAVAATWAIWTALAVFHVAFWCAMNPIDVRALALVPLLLATRYVSDEVRVWLGIGAVAALSAATTPPFLAVVAALGACAFGARAVARARLGAPSAASAVGAVFAAHLAVWTARWTGGPLPQHLVSLDAALAFVVALTAWKARVRAALLPLGAVLAHLAVQARVVTAPVTALEWGVWTTAAGFALLALGVAASVRLEARWRPARPWSPPPAGEKNGRFG